MPRRRTLLLLPLAVAMPLHAAGEAPQEVRGLLPQARQRGQARLRFMGLTIYDARLWSEQAIEPARWAELPLALELIYARALGGGPIAERSLTEMRRQRPIPDAQAERWLAAMRASFPDVTRGDRITGVLQPERGASFFHNGKPSGEVPDADFARRFFGIWLAPETSEPALRLKLLGQARG